MLLEPLARAGGDTAARVMDVLRKPLPDGDGDDPAAEDPVTRGSRVGRNEPCPCGSGRKYKRCCLPDAPR